jgi:anti-sigma factor RsiW
MTERHPQGNGVLPAGMSAAELASAYVDGQLDAAAARGFELRMAGNGELRTQVESYRRQKLAIRGLFDGILKAPVHLLLPRRRERTWTWRKAAAVAGLLIGGTAGAGVTWQMLQPGAPAIAAATQGFVASAVAAHAVNATDAIFSGNLGSDDPEQLAGWLAEGLGMPLRPPSLESAGFKLMGGRLLPDGTNAAAQFIYQRADGTRLTLYARATLLGVVRPGFEWETVGKLRACFWFTDSGSFAMVADLSQDEMKALAKLVVSQGGPS